ncbi:MAG: hypothetical protein ABEH65_08310 [Halobacteriales archaeon]
MGLSAQPLLGLVLLVVLAGCATGTGPATSPPTETPVTTHTATATATPTAAAPPTRTSTATATTTASPDGIPSIPSSSDCLTDAVPQPSAVDGVKPSPYPDPPANVTRERVVGWAQRFEIAYFRNGLLAEESPDDEYNLTEVSAYAEVRAVEQRPSEYVIRFSNSGATNYASGLHGDRWMDVGYLINETHVIRIPLTDRDQPIRATNGTVVIHCR